MHCREMAFRDKIHMKFITEKDISMKTAGIIAEYNPFHNGHKYQIEQLRRQTGADYIVIAMSGNFVQRGTPAIMDKYARTRMALHGGADLVIELPVMWATASAEIFAEGGVTLLQQLGVADYLAFGAEVPADRLAKLLEIADLLSEEPETYRIVLQQHLKKGLSFPAARCAALSSCMPECVSNIIDQPNNILAIEYLKALRRNPTLHPMQPVLISRVGDGYHDTSAKSTFASATAIRRLLLFEQPPQANARELSSLLPEESLSIINAYRTTAPLMKEDDLSQALGYRLLSLDAEEYCRYTDCDPDLARRIQSSLPEYRNFTQFCDLLKTRNMTHAHIRRSLLHILLGIRNEDYLTSCKYNLESADGSRICTKGHPAYARVLGFRKTAVPLLRTIKEHTDIPLITKLADAAALLPASAAKSLQLDIYAADLYMQLIRSNGGSAAWNEYTHGLVIL